MGKIIYEEFVKIDVDDRLLTHLQMVMGGKLRRGESFFYSWREDASVGDGRSSVWIHPNASLVFKYAGSRKPAINGAWLEALAQVANTTAGLHAVPEPGAQQNAGSDDGAQTPDAEPSERDQESAQLE